jgi:hypothetical protein
MSINLLGAKHYVSIADYVNQWINYKGKSGSDRGDVLALDILEFFDLLEGADSEIKNDVEKRKGFAKITSMDAISEWQRMNLECYNKKYDENAKFESWDNIDPKKLNIYEFFSACRSVRYQIEEYYLEMDYERWCKLDFINHLQYIIAYNFMTEGNNYDKYSQRAWDIE